MDGQELEGQAVRKWERTVERSRGTRCKMIVRLTLNAATEETKKRVDDLKYRRLR